MKYLLTCIFLLAATSFLAAQTFHIQGNIELDKGELLVLTQQVEGMDTLEILDQSFYQAFPNGDKKLLAAYTDVALNGGSCRLKTYSARIHRELIIKCFQPLENFCACVLIPAYEIEK